jgi:hypothetical protein
MDRTIVKYGPLIKYLFDPTQPRMEERVKSGSVPAAAPKKVERGFEV